MCLFGYIFNVPAPHVAYSNEFLGVSIDNHSLCERYIEPCFSILDFFNSSVLHCISIAGSMNLKQTNTLLVVVDTELSEGKTVCIWNDYNMNFVFKETLFTFDISIASRHMEI